MLKISGLTKQYRKYTAVNNFSIDINDGEIYGIVGENGAGKTTIFKMIATLIRPTKGSIELDGLKYNRRNIIKIREQIGYMPDFFGVYDNLKVIEYMDFYCNLSNINKEDKDKIIKDSLTTVHLNDKRTEYVNDLSRGMKQRLCLARAIIRDPKILILDEPASGMDPVSRAKMKEILLYLKQTGKTIIISSHILNELSEICTHLVILDSGETVIEGSIDTIMKKLDGEEILKVETLDNSIEYKQIIAQFSGVKNVIDIDSGYSITFNGDRHRKSMLLKYMINNGIDVISFRNQASNIEDIYNKVTMGGKKNEN